ncbi:MAG: class I SAM-dependent methyltransferase [Lentisphaeria bacterium]|nr:class I SAM-dependent methyltransferase [Lentisphaeria bacterium]
MDDITKNKCLVCGNASFFERAGVVRDNPELTIWECRNCGLVRLSSFDHIGKNYYQESNMHNDRPLDLESWLRETEEDDERRFRQFGALIKNKVVVDFGCGIGGFLSRAVKIAKRVYGVELERRVYPFLERQGISVCPGFGEIREKPDMIFMFHVLEHIAAPLPLLKEMRRTGARLIVEVPNADDALLTLYESDAFSRFTYWSPHLYLYNSFTLPALLKKAGYLPVSVMQFQRYPLSNHLYWLAKGLPGGHQKWHFLDTPVLNEAYSASLGRLGKCDTLIAEFVPEESEKSC